MAEPKTKEEEEKEEEEKERKNPLANFLAYELRDHIERKKKLLEEIAVVLPQKDVVKLRDNIELFEKELRRRPESPTATHSLLSKKSEPHYTDIFTILPPHLRWAYHNLEKEFEFHVQCLKHDMDVKSKADSIMLDMRKLCVDSNLVTLKETPTITYLKSIRDAPELVSEMSHTHTPCCRKCGSGSNVIFTSCPHSLCVPCIAYLSSENNLICHVCKHLLRAADSCCFSQITLSKIDVMIELLTKETNKCIVFCDFPLPLNNLHSRLIPLHINGVFCTDHTQIHHFCNSQTSKVLFATSDLIHLLSSYNVNCSSSIYFMSALPTSLQQKAISLINHGTRQNLHVYKIMSNESVEAKIDGIDIGTFTGGQLVFSASELIALANRPATFMAFKVPLADVSKPKLQFDVGDTAGSNEKPAKNESEKDLPSKASTSKKRSKDADEVGGKKKIRE